jgi:hypothetical protein
MSNGDHPGQGTAGATDAVSALKGITQQLSALVKATRSYFGGGQVTASNSVSTAFAQIIAANAQRYTITFHNPGTVTLYVGPMTLANGSPNTPTLGALGGTYQLVSGGLLVLDGQCQLAYGAMAASGATNPVTVTES